MPSCNVQLAQRLSTRPNSLWYVSNAFYLHCLRLRGARYGREICVSCSFSSIAFAERQSALASIQHVGMSGCRVHQFDTNDLWLSSGT